MTEHRWLDDAAAWALGTLDEAERAAFEAHLADCELCRSAVQEYGAVTRLLDRMKPAAPPPGLRERIVAEAARTRPGASPSAGRRWVSLAMAATLAAIVLGSLWVRERQARRRGEDALAAADRSLLDTRAALAERDSLLATFAGPDVRTATLVTTGAGPAVRLFWNRSMSRIVIAASGLPTAPAGRTYQLWGIAQGSNPVSLGTFDPGTDGRATLALNVPPGMDFALAAVSEEPAGGSPQPTTTPILAGAWRASE